MPEQVHYDSTQQQFVTDQLVWTLTDNENTVRDLATYSNGTTTVENHREFSAYGELLSQTNPQTGQAAAVDCVFAYTGRALDEATGLQNNDERWYEAITGRWLSQDPRVFRGGDANLYRYVGNNPLGNVDPTGTQERPVPLPPVSPPGNEVRPLPPVEPERPRRLPPPPDEPERPRRLPPVVPLECPEWWWWWYLIDTGLPGWLQPPVDRLPWHNNGCVIA